MSSGRKYSPDVVTGIDTPPATDVPSGPRPGLVLVVECDQPVCRTVAFGDRPISIGRDLGCDLSIDDYDVSRFHAVAGLASGRPYVHDQSSALGTWVDGWNAKRRTSLRGVRVVRVGRSLLVPVADVGPFEEYGVTQHDGRVTGPALATALRVLRDAAESGWPVVITGESGTGKEFAAREYHRHSGRGAGPFVVVNCGRLDRALAAGALFGSVRGAFTGSVATVKGAFEQAHGGTLYLDEFGELDLAVQVMFLRVLEDGRVQPVGASTSVPVDVRVVVATNRDLEAMVAANQFRGDLYHRLADERVHLPPLRERTEEIPWLVTLAVAQAAAERRVPGMRASATFVEMFVRHTWDEFNVRTLFGSAKRAVSAAARSKVPVTELTAKEAPWEVGVREPAEEREAGAGEAAEAADAKNTTKRAAFFRALATNGGSVPKAAKEAEVGRSTGYRWVEEGEK